MRVVKGKNLNQKYLALANKQYWDGFSLQEKFTIFLMVCFVFEKIETFLDSFAIIKMFIVANGRILNTQFWPCVHTGYRDTNLCMCFCQKIE